MRTTWQVLALAGLIIGVGGEATAQAPRGGMPPRGPEAGAVRRGPGGGVTAILNARRQLDLSPRQVAQLDSIERVLHNERKQVEASLRPAMDSMRARMRSSEGRPDSAQRVMLRAQAERRRETMRPQMERLRQRDSVSTAAAERILTDAQRTQWRELQAERRGFVRGMQAGRGGGRMMIRGPRDGRGPQPMRAPGMRGPDSARPAPGAPGRRPDDAP